MFPEMMEFHVSEQIGAFVQWMTVAWGTELTSFSDLLLALIVSVRDFLLIIPWWLWVGGIGISYWLLTRRILTTLILAALFMSIGMFGLWHEAMETLSVVIVAVIIAVTIGIPVGIAMSESDRVRTVLIPLLDGMQTMPSFVYLIPALMLFSLGKVPAVMATVIYAVPPIARLTDLGIRQVSESVQEAAEAFGATRWQMMREVRLPLAMPSIMAGINQTTMMALAMVVIASMVGAGGLGEKVLVAINRIDVGSGFEAGFAVVALAIVIDRLTQGLARRWQPPV